ncbi:MAG: SBBP repeat-containing protein [Crocinitomicaceae bacterium]|nr:SBBP repeat-containing protein [Flavobacteriales bacterium]NQZ34689.1 SBBP repeat-containing protein [Crocinitomicaceae bacterium]
MKKIYITTLVTCLALVTTAQNVSYEWAKQMGGTSSDNAASIITDALGNVYTTGEFNGTADFDPGVGISNLTAIGFEDIFIQKLDAAGNFLWTKHIGGTSSEYGRSITIDALGNLYITGYFKGTVDFDPNSGISNLTATGNFDFFILKLDTAGNFVWAKKIGGTGSDKANSITTDNLGNVYTTGNFSGTVDFDPNAGTNNLTANGNNLLFILKLDTAGNFVWAKKMGGVNSASITTDSSGNIYTTGYFNGTSDFDPSTTSTVNLTPIGQGDIFILKLDAAGNFVWAKQMGGTTNDFGYSISTDVWGNVYTTGNFSGTADFDPSAATSNLTALGFDAAFIQKLNAAGNFVWAKQIEATASYGYSITTDALGSVYTSGTFHGTADFDPSTDTSNLIANGIYDAFIQKLDAAGDFVWAKQLAGTSYSYGYSITIDPLNNIYVTGTFNGTADFDPGLDTSNLISIAFTFDTYTLKLSQCIIDNSTTTAGNTFTANATNATYQWLDCNNNNAIISGETNALFTPTTAGNYAVELTVGNCVDTSACINSTLEIQENSLFNAVRIYPNPTQNIVNIDLGSLTNVTVTVSNVLGKTTSVTKATGSNQQITLPNEKGLYFVQLNSNGKSQTFKVIKE